MTIGRSLASLGVAAALGVALATGGCATAGRQAQGTDVRRTEELLVASGFRRQSADTPEARAELDTVLPFSVVSRMRDGQLTYTYADPYVCRCLYVGTPEDYQTYTQLATDRRVKDSWSRQAEDENIGREWDLWAPWRWQ
jgi:hypothetical protein